MNRRSVRISLLVTAALLLLICGLVAWAVATQSGTRWLLGQAEPMLPAELDVGQVSGTLLEGITISGAGWADEAQRIDVGRLTTEIELLPILRRTVRITRLDIEKVQVDVLDRAPAPPSDEPFSLDLPIALMVEDAIVRDVRFTAGENRIDVDRVVLTARLAGPDLEVDRLVVESELGDLTATASGHLADHYDATANVTWNLRLPEQPTMSGQLKLHGDAAGYEVTHELKAPYAIATEGEVSIVDDSPAFDLVNSWQRVDIAAGDDRSINLGNGSLRIVGKTDEFDYEIRSNVSTDDVPPLVVTSAGGLAADSVNIDALSVFSDHGRLSASGQVDLSAQSPWEFAFDITDADASLADTRLSGSIDARGTSSGRIIDGRPIANVTIDDLAGDLNGHPVDGAADLAYADDSLQVENAIVEVGDNIARFSARFGEELELDASLEFEALAQLGLDLSGSASGDIRAATDFEVLEIDGTIGGADLAWREYSAERLDTTFAIPKSGRGTASTRIANARVGDTMIDNIDLNASGTALAHQLRATTVAQDVRTAATVDASLADGRWSGSISALSVIGDLLGEWRLQESGKFAASDTGLKLDKTCLESDAGKGFACVEFESDDSGALRFDVAVDDIPMAALPVAWPEGAIVTGFIEGGANGQLANGRLTSGAEVRLRDLSLRTDFEGEEVAADFERAIATATIDDNRLDGQFELRLRDSMDNLGGRLVVADVFDRQSTMNGAGSIELNELALVSFFVPSVTNPAGRIAGTVEIAGSLAAPDIVGEIGLSDGAFGLANAGITVTDVAVTLRQSEPGRLAIDGRANSGDGILEIAGATSLNSGSGIRTELTLNGENFVLVKLPDWQVTASPAIAVTIDENEARVIGELGIPAANVTFRELPAGVQKPSPDVVIHRGETAAVPQRFIVDLDVRTSLGDAVSLSGFGLTTGLEGSVRIAGRSDTTYTSSGRLVLREGRYSAYGQELNIDSGELLFSGPLDNPTLNVRASRTASDGTVAGIHLTGTPKQPRSEVYSEPATSDVEALSYLLTGRPLSNATGDEGDTLNQAAFALGLTSAGSVVSRIRNELGLETLGVQGSADSRQFFAGKRFGSRLFVEYAYGIVDNLGTLLLRYQLNRRLVVESRSGTVRTVDVVYSVKKP